MVQAIGTASDLPPERRKALLRLWVSGNASAACTAGSSGHPSGTRLKSASGGANIAIG